MSSSDGTGSAMRDRDEVRRLAYMALFRQRTEKYELAGTLVNALAHHCPDPDGGLEDREIANHVIAVLEHSDGYGISENWLRDQIERITIELGQ